MQGRLANLFFCTQTANTHSQIIGLFLLSQIRKFLEYASPQIAKAKPQVLLLIFKSQIHKFLGCASLLTVNPQVFHPLEWTGFSTLKKVCNLYGFLMAKPHKIRPQVSLRGK